MHYPYAHAARRFTDKDDRDRFAQLALGIRSRPLNAAFKLAAKHARFPILPECR